MTNKDTRTFTPSDDALILQQPFTRVGLNKLAKMLHTSQERSCGGLANSAFRWTSVVIISRTHERSVAATNSSTRYWNG